MLKKSYCNICGKLEAETKTKRLVRDHNHKTGFIRGWLCDDCNQKLGTYESKNRFISKYKTKEYWIWVRTYEGRIKYHLTCNTGVKYTFINKIKTGYSYCEGTVSGRLKLPRPVK